MTTCYSCIHRGGYASCGSDQCRYERRLEDIAHAINDMKRATERGTEAPD